MKIYPSTHKIMETEQLNIEQIPLAYIDTGTDNGEINIWREKEAARANSEKRVWPFAVFNIPDPMLFDANGYPAEKALEKQGLQYVYIPKDTIQFRPLYFTADALVKKNLTYQTGRSYNIEIGASADTLENVASLMQLFGDAAKRNLCPGNITVNGGSLQTSSLIDKNIQDCDVLFVESADGINIMTDGEATKIDYDSLLADNLIVWVFTDTTSMFSAGGGTYSLTNNVLFKDKTYTTTGYDKVANPTAALTQFQGAKIFNLFTGPSPVNIIEKAGKGYVILSQRDLLKAANGRLVYEILMAVYLKAYYRTNSRQLWITNETVDEVIGSEITFNRKHPSFNIDEELVNDDCLIDSYDIVAINTSDGNLYVDSIDKMNNVFFGKSDAAATDPLRPSGMKSAYDNNGSILYYKNEALRILETDIPVYGGNDDTGFYIDVGPCCSSALKLFLADKQRFYLESDGPYVLVANNGSLEFKQESSYEEAQGDTKLATVKVSYGTEPVHLDIRIPGGGLPTHMDDDYNMMDISSYKGRPLRKGSVCIIHLPKEVATCDTYIQEAIKAHAAAGSETVIVYE